MKTIHKVLCIPFWLAVFMAVLGYIMTFVPGGEYSWFVTVATLSVFGLFVPKTFYRCTAVFVLILSILAAMHGHQRGVEYRQWLAMHRAKTPIVAPDPISRFVANYSNHRGSIAYHSTGVSSLANPQEAIEKLLKTGMQPGITNLNLIEVRKLSVQEQSAHSSLTNCAVAVVATETGQRIVHLRPINGVWWYHVYDST